MNTTFRWLALAAFLFVPLTGCGKKSANQDEQKPPVVNDDPAAVSTLEALSGTTLTKNDTGNVTKISIASDEGIADALTHLSGLPSLQEARFTGPGVNDEGMSAIESLSSLTRLDLSDSAITDKTLDSVAKLTNLQALFLRRCGVSDEALGKLAGLSKLRGSTCVTATSPTPGWIIWPRSNRSVTFSWRSPK